MLNYSVSSCYLPTWRNKRSKEGLERWSHQTSLSHKHKDPSLHLKYPPKMQARWHVSITPKIGLQSGDSHTSQLDDLHIPWKVLSQNPRWGVIHWPPHTHMCTHTRMHIHTLLTHIHKRQKGWGSRGVHYKLQWPLLVSVQKRGRADRLLIILARLGALYPSGPDIPHLTCHRKQRKLPI